MSRMDPGPVTHSYTQELKDVSRVEVASPTQSNRVSLRSLSLWVAAAVSAVALQAVLTTRCDSALRGVADPFLDDTPADVNRPFVATRREQQIRARYKEPVIAPAPAQSAVARPRPPELNDALLAKARKFYDVRCASCHGAKGNGNGPAAEMIKPAPRNFLDNGWQKTTTDETIYKTILKGGQAVGKSYMMPATFDLNGKPDMVNALVYVVRSFSDNP